MFGLVGRRIEWSTVGAFCRPMATTSRTDGRSVCRWDSFDHDAEQVHALAVEVLMRREASPFLS